MQDRKVRVPEDPDERARYAASLGKRATPDEVAVLARLLRDSDPDVRLAAVESLEEIGSRGSGTSGSPDLANDCAIALTAALADQNAHIRWRAARACARLESREVVFALTRLLGDDNKHVAWAAADALERIGDPRGRRAVEDFKRSRRIQGG